MAVLRDQAARVLRQDQSEQIEDEAATANPAALAEQLRSHVAEEGKRRTGEAPEKPAIETPAAETPASATPAAPKSPKRKRFVMMGIGALLALAAASYAGYYTLIGRFYVATDDAYVRANNTMLGARVAGHIASILPGDNALVHAGDVVLRIDSGDYKIAVDAAATKIATQQATIDRIGRQVAALEAQVAQATPVPQRISETEKGVSQLQGQVDQAQARLQQAELNQLEAWSENLFDAQSLQSVFE